MKNYCIDCNKLLVSRAYNKNDYKLLVVWEHELKDIDYLVGKLISYQTK